MHTTRELINIDPSARENAEYAIVEAIFSNPDFQPHLFAGFTDPQIFDDEHLSTIFSAALDVHRAGMIADFITVRQRMEETVGVVPEWYTSLVSDFEDIMGTSPAAIDGWKRCVIDNERFSDFKRGALSARSMDDVIAVAVRALEVHGVLSGNDEPDIEDACNRFIDRQRAIIDGRELAGHSWGVTALDDAIPLRPGCLYTVAGIKKGGKSQLVLHTIAHNVLNENPCLVFSLEMSVDNVLTRWAALRSGVNSRRILTKAAKEYLPAIEDAVVEISSWPVRINQSAAIGIGEITARARSWYRTEKVAPGMGIVAVDFVQLVQYEQKNRQIYNEASQIKHIAYGLARLAKELNISVIAVAQFRNDAEGQRPSIRYIEGSGGISQASEGILLLDLISRREENYTSKKTEEWKKMDVIVYQRNGESGIPVPLEVDLETTKFR